MAIFFKFPLYAKGRGNPFFASNSSEDPLFLCLTPPKKRCPAEVGLGFCRSLKAQTRHRVVGLGSRIIQNIEEAEAFEKAYGGNCVFKQFLSFSGMGHARKATDIRRFPCLLEPWFERTLDFSTQWIVEASHIEYLGDTHLLVASGGGYRGTEIGCISIEKTYLDLHFGEVYPLLEMIQKMGFRGNVGIDAFVHKEGFVPICEMNPRKTMGYVAL
ncbi:hypothetical protein EB008_07425, partial [bacterium]|nr:hypothetical protein [bacterium]